VPTNVPLVNIRTQPSVKFSELEPKIHTQYSKKPPNCVLQLSN